MRRIHWTILAIACGGALGGCGQKGPLYLPPPAAAPQSKAPAAAPARAADQPYPAVPATTEKK